MPNEKPKTAADLIADLKKRNVLLATDGNRVWSTTKGITPGVNREIQPMEKDIIKELQRVRSE